MKRIIAFFKNLNVGAKLSFGIVTIVFLLMGATLGYLINSYRDKLIEDSKRIMMSELRIINEKLIGELTDMGDLANSLAVAQEDGFFGNREASVRMVKNYMSRYKDIHAAFINLEPDADGQDERYAYDTVNCVNGRFVPIAIWLDPIKKENMRIRPIGVNEKGVDPTMWTLPWYTEPKKNAQAFLSGGGSGGLKQVTITDPFLSMEGEPITSLSVPIIIDNQFKGVAGVDKSLQAFREELGKLKPYKSAVAFLVSRNKKLIASSLVDKKWLNKPVRELKGYNEEFYQIFDEKQGGIKRFIRPGDNESALYAYEKNGPTGWTLGMSVLESDILGPVYTTITQISIGAAVALILSIGAVFFFSNRVVVRPVQNIMELFSEIGMGNFEARAEVKTQDELGVMAESLNAMLDNTLTLIQSREERDAMQRAVVKLLEEITSFTEGDLTARAEVTEDITGAIADSFNLMAEQIGGIVRQVSHAAESVTETSGEVHASTEELALRSTDQASQILEAVKTINTMADTIRSVADTAVQSAEVSGQSTVHARQGADAVGKTHESMSAIRENVQETARAIKRLGESSQEIGNIVQIISDIADRTSILALNASIQAAMAGDAGRGFAVVAEEVQRLAERSTSSANQIDTIIQTIQGEITEASASMDASIQRVVEGAQLADNARSRLEEIQAVSGRLAELIQTISRASEEQAKISEQTSRTMENIGQISSSTSKTSLATASRMNDLEATANQLMASIAAFKIEAKTI